MLFDPRQSRVSDPLGGSATGYRCNEFGHLCDGAPPPHTVTGDTMLQNCRSSEQAGRLVPVSQIAESLKSFKPDPVNQIFVAALAGPVTPYIVEPRPGTMIAGGGTETPPALAHSCGPRVVPPGSNTVFADPGVRIRQWVEAFESHGVFENICTANFGDAMARIALELGRLLALQCLGQRIATTEEGAPDCQVALRRRPPTGLTLVEEPLPRCQPGNPQTPCWQIVSSPVCNQELQICYDAACSLANTPADAVSATVACAAELRR
jgi:hypothetical protein